MRLKECQLLLPWYEIGVNFTAKNWGPWDNAPRFTDLFSLSDFMISFYEFKCCISLSFLQGDSLFLPSQ